MKKSSKKLKTRLEKSLIQCYIKQPTIAGERKLVMLIKVEKSFEKNIKHSLTNLKSCDILRNRQSR
jgi:hypothetical protein